MIEPIEHFVRGFGGRQTPYFCVSKAGLKARSALAARSARDAIGRLTRRHAVGPRRDRASSRSALGRGRARAPSGWSPWAVAASALHAGHERDVATLHGFTGLYRSWLDSEIELTARAGRPVPYAPVGLACIAVALARGAVARAPRSESCCVGTGLTTQVLKHALAEQRYADWLGFGQIDPASWPSGHATAALTLALCAVMVAPPAWRVAVGLVGGRRHPRARRTPRSRWPGTTPRTCSPASSSPACGSRWRSRSSSGSRRPIRNPPARRVSAGCWRWARSAWPASP